MAEIRWFFCPTQARIPALGSEYLRINLLDQRYNQPYGSASVNR